MTQETVSVMSTYEIVATIIALIALIQPWIIKLWSVLIKKAKIMLIPSGKIKLFYNRSGAYVQIGGVIEAKNQSVVIRNISGKITRLSDNAELKMDWSSFNTPVFQNIGGNIVTTTEIARPFKVKGNDLAPIFVEFTNIDSVFVNRMMEIHNSLSAQARAIATPDISLEQARNEFKKTNAYKEAKEELIESFYWKASQYILVISVYYGSHAKQDFFYKFSLDLAETTEFKKNIERSMDCAIDNLYGQTPTFYFPLKDYIEAEGLHINV